MKRLANNVHIYSIAEFVGAFPEKRKHILGDAHSKATTGVVYVAKDTHRNNPIQLPDLGLEKIYIIVEEEVEVSFLLDELPPLLDVLCNVAKDSKVFLFPIIQESVELTIEVNLQQAGAEGYIAGYYKLANNHKVKIKTLQQHQAPHTTSALAINGILSDESQAWYQGTICIEPNAPYSDAAQSNKNILLGKEARAVSIPNLEVKTNEVQCRHGSAVGTVDFEQLVYMQSRGLSAQQAKKLLLESFMHEVFKNIPRNHFNFLLKK